VSPAPANTSPVIVDARRDRTGGLTAQRREEIQRVAADQFAELGYLGASLRQIAAGAGLAPGHLYYYYRSKQDLLNDVITGLQRRFNESMDRAQSASGSVDEVLRALLTEHVTTLGTFVTAATVSYESMRFLTVEHRTALVLARDRYEQGLRALIDAYRPIRPVAETPTPLLGKVILGIVNWPYQWYRPAGAMRLDELAATLADRAITSLRAG
jgi:TetR/AcrR family transcriptional regulator, cholesterol catabolism regulator